MCWDAMQQFAADTRSPGDARHFCTEQLTGVLADRPERAALVDDVTLVISELVTNSVTAGAAATTVHLVLHRDELRIAVDDDAPGLPTVQSAARDDSRGRGLAITQSLSDAWGVQPHPGDQVGKQVWAEIGVAVLLTSALACHR